MKRFQFQLEVALKWRQQRVAAQQARVEHLLGGLASIDKNLNAADSEWKSAQESTLGLRQMSAEDFRTLDAFRRGIDRRRALLQRDQQRIMAEIVRQQKVLIEENRQCRLLEKLKDRKQTEWQQEADKELEREAAEIYLSQWKPG